jgi:DNA polymerase III sliding clamp (beta) subunit (PCNA family)
MLTRGLQGAMLHHSNESEHSMQFSIQRNQLKAMSRLAATSDIRYYLNGLHVVQDNRGTYIEATNGHMLGRLLIDETPIANPCSVIMPLDSVKTLAATGKKGRETVCFTVDGVKISAINPQGETMIFQAIEGKFPDCDRVVPTLTSDSGLEPSTYNPEYIAAFYDCANDLRGCKANGITVQIKQRGNDSGIVNIDSEPLFVGIIMPMRTHNSVNIPTWCSRPKVAATEPVAA